MALFPPIDVLLQDRVKYGFLPDDTDDDIMAIIHSEESLEKNGSSSDPDKKIMSELQEAAKNYHTARVTITFKPQESVVSKFKERARKEGIPYQVLLNSVMKKYAEGSLVQREEAFSVK